MKVSDAAMSLLGLFLCRGGERVLKLKLSGQGRGSPCILSAFFPSLTAISCPCTFWELVLLILLCPARSEGLT